AAEGAFPDPADGKLARSPIAACQANAALARRLAFRLGTATATFYVAAGGTRNEAYALLRGARARGTSPEAQRAATEAWWASFLAPAHLPDTDDAEVQAFAKRSLIVMRTATDPASGAYLADVCPSIQLGADNLAACKDSSSDLQCMANEDDNIPLTQGLQGAETVLLALRNAVAAAPACGFDAPRVLGWETRAMELEQA